MSHSGAAKTMVLRTGASAVSMMAQNLVPPVFPMAGRWNAAVLNHIPAVLESSLRAVMIESQACDFSVAEMQIEENAGLGFGLSVLLLASIAAACFARRKKASAADSPWLLCVRWPPVISLLALMTQFDLSCIARILTPHYLPLLPVLLAGPGQSWLVRRRWWRSAAFMVFLVAGGLLVISPARPLFPVEPLLEKFPDAPARMREVYSVYALRNDGFAPARAALPPGLKVLGMVTYDDPETSLGTRSVRAASNTSARTIRRST